MRFHRKVVCATPIVQIWNRFTSKVFHSASWTGRKIFLYYVSLIKQRRLRDMYSQLIRGRGPFQKFLNNKFFNYDTLYFFWLTAYAISIILECQETGEQVNFYQDILIFNCCQVVVSKDSIYISISFRCSKRKLLKYKNVAHKFKIHAHKFIIRHICMSNRGSKVIMLGMSGYVFP